MRFSEHARKRYQERVGPIDESTEASILEQIPGALSTNQRGAVVYKTVIHEGRVLRLVINLAEGIVITIIDIVPSMKNLGLVALAALGRKH